MNLLQVTPTNVYPPSDGGQHRSHGLVTSFPSAGDVVYRYCQGGHLDNYLSRDLKRTIHVSDNYREFQHLNPVFDLTRLPELFGLPNVFIEHSLKLLRPTQLTERFDWADVILVELPWQVAAVAELAEDTPVVYSSHNVEEERFESNGESAVSDWFVSKISAVERRALEASAAVVCTSDRDRDEFRRRFDVALDAIIAPNGVSEQTIATSDSSKSASVVSSRHEIDADAYALFVGTDYGPNREAAQAIVRMAEESSRIGLDVHFLVVGSVGQSLSQSPDNVTVTGFVPDLDPYYEAADIGLNPIMSGSGTNIKFLEYLAQGLPVVTTEFGARGFDVSHCEEALVVRQSEFVNAIETLLTEPHTRNLLSERGLAYVRRNHLWERISSDLRNRLVELVR